MIVMMTWRTSWMRKWRIECCSAGMELLVTIFKVSNICIMDTFLVELNGVLQY